MMLADYHQTHSWRAAIGLGPELIKLAEQLPDAEQLGLGQQLRQLMVELPGAIALDLVQGTNVRLPLALRLTAALELIEHIYPALDAAPARTALADLTERLTSDRFAESATATAPSPASPAPEPDSHDTPVEASTSEPPAGVIHVQPDSSQ